MTTTKAHKKGYYDFIYQFAQIELFGLGAPRLRLPPIVLHPGTLAAGEVRWHRREACWLGERASRARSVR